MAEILGKITGTAIAKIISILLPILLTLFPNNTSFISIDQQINNHSGIGASKIIAAFEEKDVSALEELMCYNIKQNTEDLPGKINEMYSCVDGDIVELIEEESGSSFSANHGDGKQILQTSINIKIISTKKEYNVGVIWETINTIQTEETGIRSIVLLEKSTTDNNYNKLYEIKATEGVSGWHE